ncbi:MAG: P-loop ATPase, Sll1717 family [Fimbriimonadaceae bacterium]
MVTNNPNLGEPLFDLADSSLFGAEAAEAESSQAVFSSYFFETLQFHDFADPGRPLQIANAYKGEGKSAFLRAVEQDVRGKGLGFVVRISSADLDITDQGESSDGWMRAWRRALGSTIASELGKAIKVAWSEDDIRAVEEAERQGDRERNFLGLILDRFAFKAKGIAAVEVKPASAAISEKTIERLLEKKTVWLLVDESDVNFINTTAGRAKVAGLLTACRKLCQTSPSLRIRTTLRPTTWSALYSNVEDMTHVRDALLPLQWQTQDIRNILAKRIEAYLKRAGREELTRTSQGGRMRDEDLIGLLFPGKWKWAKRTVSDDGERMPVVVLSNLCRDRPRWLVELCKEAAKRARARESEVIDKADVTASLAEFGRRRIQDLQSEFRAESEQIETLVNGFYGQPESYKTDELLKLIKNRIENHADVRISYENGRCNAMQIGHFLYRIGFLTARKDLASGDYEHFSYAQRPTLLRDSANPDQGCSWEVHPIYRQALEMRDESGFIIASQTKRHGKEAR